MRSTSTQLDKGGNYAHGNSDNASVAAGETKVVLDAQGPGAITHMWFTFLGPERQAWAKNGSANHQEILLRVFYDGKTRPAIEVPFGDFFANCFGHRAEVISQPVIVEDGDSYNCFWHMADPIVFNTSIKITIEHWGWISSDENAEGKTHSWNERQDDYSSIAFWYQTGEPSPQSPVPHAKDRRLPNLDTIIPAKHYTQATHHGQGSCRVQDNLGFYPDGQLFYQPGQPDDAWVEIPFTVTQKEPTRLLLSVTRANDYGIYQAYLNGVKIGAPLDLYSKSVVPWESHLLDFWPDPGDYQLRLVCVGKNPQSLGHYLGLEAVRLRQRCPRVKQWGKDKDKDWQEDPILYR